MPALTETEAAARAVLIDVISYDVFADLTAEPVRSRTEIRFTCAQPGAATFADLTARAVSAVLNRRELGPPDDGRLVLPGLLAENTLVVEAEADGDVLMRFTDPAGGAGYVLFTGYPTLAPGLFCCFDQVDLTATITLSLVLPAGWECLANGPVISRPEAGEGVPCPYPKYDIGFVPRLDALAISMPGLMLVSENLLARMADPDDDFVAMVCAHEVSHLWFGCHISSRWWDDLWLDEAMASYVSYLAMAEAGMAGPWTALSYREKPRAYEADALPGRAGGLHAAVRRRHREPGRPDRLLVPLVRPGPGRLGAGMAAHRGREHAAGLGDGWSGRHAGGAGRGAGRAADAPARRRALRPVRARVGAAAAAGDQRGGQRGAVRDTGATRGAGAGRGGAQRG